MPSCIMWNTRKNQPDIKFDFDGSIKNENYQLKGKALTTIKELMDKH